MKILTVALLSVLLVACDGAKARLIKTLYDNRVSTANAGTILPAGTLISWGCDEYTRLNEVADGNGGSTTEEIERSPDCGWNPPEAGTVSETRCEDPYTLVTVFHDGEYGFYEEETDTRSEECGYEPPVVTAIKEQGDRFDPVIFGLETSLPDEEVTVEVTLGLASVEDGQILIRGAGQTGEGTLLVNDEEYQYTINPEPRCPSQSNFTDCQGYSYSGPSGGYIYYGEEDDRIVEWEIGIVYYTSEECDFTNPDHRCIGISSSLEHAGAVITHEVGSPTWEVAQKRVDRYNAAYEKSGVFIRYVLRPGNVVDGHYHGPTGINRFGRIMDTDVTIGIGATCSGTCGCAYVNKTFKENSYARGGVSVCGWDTDLHEIGHAVGLAHGPDNSANQASGYIWREFGHGHSGGVLCASDLMSYSNGSVHLNSNVTCEEMFTYQSGNTNPTGDRTIADAAYHLNRIRYDVSLVHCENDMCSQSAASDETNEEPVEGELIQDKIQDFEDGAERYIEFMNEMPRYRPDDMSHAHEH